MKISKPPAVEEKEELKPIEKLTDASRKELYQLGPKAFCRKHGYNPQGSGPLFVACRANLKMLSPEAMREVTAKGRRAKRRTNPPRSQAPIEKPQDTDANEPQEKEKPSVNEVAAQDDVKAAAVILKPSVADVTVDDFETATMEIIDNLALKLQQQEQQQQQLAISNERIKMEMTAYGVALDMYRNRYQPQAIRQQSANS
ncbi:MAG: hypothetical protein WC359_12890 [Dehalococcoidia bacterium]